MQLLHGNSIGEVELTAFIGLKVIRRFPVGESSSDRYALTGNSHPTAYSRMPPRIGGGETFFPWTRFAVLVKSSRLLP